MRNTELTNRARTMRRQMTEPETRLWLSLRAKRFENVKSRRQKVIGPYIADFASRRPMLVIELDGDTHAGQADYDRQRTKFLEAEGYRVMRFSNAEVTTNLEGVLTTIASALAPLPTLSPEVERAI